MPETPGPHRQLSLSGASQVFAARLFDRLWERYRQRVSYVNVYEKLICDSGARFQNDHIAFRTIATRQQLSGISVLSPIFEALGYRAAGVYCFEDKHLNAVHFQHANIELPKIFISELKSWELAENHRIQIESALASQRFIASGSLLAKLAQIDAQEFDEPALGKLLEQTLECFGRGWDPPEVSLVREIHEVSQYAAWTLVHGYEVNHFTSLINSHGVSKLDTIEKTIAALSDAGVPMKDSIEGEAGAKLRQSATAAVTIEVPVSQAGCPAKIPWSYAYFELAERNPVQDSETGEWVRFEGFLGSQATNLFEMTKKE